MVVFGPNRTKQVVRSAKFGPEGRTMHSSGNDGFFSARIGQRKSSDRPSSARRAAPCIAPGEAPGGRRNPGYDSKLELRPEGATLARHVASQRARQRHVVHPISMADRLLTPYGVVVWAITRKCLGFAGRCSSRHRVRPARSARQCQYRCCEAISGDF